MLQLTTHSSGGGILPGSDYTNGPNTPPRFQTVTAAILHHILTLPDETAAIDHSSPSPRSLTYAELGRRAARVARSLHDGGVQPGDRVPLVVRRGLEMVVGIVAILCCGAQYVPLDGNVVPKETLRRVVEQSRGKVALCLESTAHRVTELEMGDCKPVVIDEGDCDAPDFDHLELIRENFMNSTTEDSGCYVIYTSGTTGMPKGVDVTHKNVANLLCSSPGNLGIRQGVRVGQVLSISFDMAAWEILGTLCNGGTLVLRGSDWLKTIREIDVLICTASILARYLPKDLPNLKTVATAGEPISVQMADLWASHLEYYNCCGPTETTIVNTMQRHTAGQPLSIGRPTPNNTVYILDEELNPVPVGEMGVIWAGGNGISRGYVGLPEMTSEKYIADTFSNDGSMMYNTGDIGLWLPDGTIQIQGRSDDQVKVKGFRVELDGIAACLCAAPEVTKAVVLHVGGELHAFLQPQSCHIPAVRESTRSTLPYYAQPSHYHVLRAFPLTQNGKVDKAFLRGLAECDDGGSGNDSDGGSQPSSDRGSSSRSVGSGTSFASSQTSVVMSDLERVGGKDRSRASSGSSGSSFTSTQSIATRDVEKQDLDEPVPDKSLPQPLRGLLYRILIPYRFLFSLVWIANAAVAVAVFVNGPDRAWLGNMVAVNLALAVLIRQDHVINALYYVACSIPRSWPLWIRASSAKIYHLGGVHSSAASCAGLWLLAGSATDAVCLSLSTCPGYPTDHSLAYAVLSWVLVAMFLSMIVFAYPSFRKANHNFFERWHRFMGWTMLALFWAQTMVGVHDASRHTPTHFGLALCSSPAFWLVLLATASIALSWLTLRRVPVVPEVLSDHAVRLHFDYAAPVNGSFTRVSSRPLSEWHSFATIPAPAPHGPPGDPARFPAGHSLTVSNAGDWTRKCIRDPPTRMWVRGVPTCGVMHVATLFNRVLIVATGSGIGPCLGSIQAPSCPTQVLWSTRDPESSFGGIADRVREKVPGAVIWDTNKQGRPDMLRLSYNMAKEFGAEAVVIIANEKITKKVVYGLETRGIPAYGAIWDS